MASTLARLKRFSDKLVTLGKRIQTRLIVPAGR